MRKFRFNLQRLLDYKVMIEESLMAELAALQAEYAGESERLKKLEQEKNQFSEKMKQKLNGGTPDEIRAADGYFQQLCRECIAQQVVVHRLREKKDRKTVEVVEASKDRKVLEQLKEQKKCEHKKEIDRQEQKFLDDLASIRFSREHSADGCPTGGAV